MTYPSTSECSDFIRPALVEIFPQSHTEDARRRNCQPIRPVSPRLVLVKHKGFAIDASLSIETLQKLSEDPTTRDAALNEMERRRGM